MIRAAIYARFSMERQNPVTIEDQLAQCDAYALFRSMNVVARIADQALSGAVTKTRPGVLRLMDLVRGREIDVIICTSLDRLTRDPELNEKLLKLLPYYGVEAHYSQSGGPISPIEQRVRAMVSAEQLKDVSVKTWQGQRGHVLRGKAVAGLSYGYSILVHHDQKGDRVPGLRIIDKDEAEVVRRIFKDYSLGVSPRDIAKNLNDEGVAGPRGERWRDTTIRGHQKRGTGILNNEMYIGRRVWNRQQYLKNPDTEKRNARLNKAEDLVTVEVPELRIVEQSLWDLVKIQQSLRAKVIEEKAGNWLTANKRPRYIFSGLIRCGSCQGPYAIMGKDRYGCTNHRKQLGCDNSRTISRHELEHRVNSAIPDALLAPASLQKMQKTVARIHAGVRRVSSISEDDLRKELKGLNEQINHLVAAIGKGLISSSVTEALKEAEARKADAIKRLDEFEKVEKSKEPPRLNAGLIQIATKALSEAALQDSDCDQVREWRRLAQSVIEKIVIHPLQRGVAIDVYGRLAVLMATVEAWNAEEMRLKRDYHSQFIKLRTEGKFKSTADRLHFLEGMNREIEKRKRSFERFLTSQLTVVAGAGFEPATFRL